MKKLKFSLAAVAAALLIGGTAALAVVQAGTIGDPLISQSYAEGTYRNRITAKAASLAKSALDTAQTTVTGTLTNAQAAYTDRAIEDKLAVQVAAALGAVPRQTAALSAGTEVSAAFGAELCLTDGAVSLSSGTLLNLTTGRQVAVGGALVHNQLYLAAEGGAVLRATAASRLEVRGSYTTDGSAPGSGTEGGSADGTETGDAQYIAYANALRSLGLFSGTDKGYELDRASTRAEGLVMLLRLLGEEQKAQAYSGAHPFRDVPAWANKYVAYAYHMGYASGISAAEYGAQRLISMDDYMTFLLRALGYNDAAGDFSWRTAGDTAVQHGILTASHQQRIAARGSFYRDDIVYTSYQALFASRKGGAGTLGDQLIEKGLFAQVDLDNAAEFTR